MYKYSILLFLLIPVSAWADMNDAMQALKSGDYTRAATELKPLAEQGNAVAQSHLGYLYYTGEGVPQSFEEAVKWYLKAAVQGNRDAQYNLAVAYAFGEGEKQDYKEAAIWYRRAAEQGHSVAQYSLALSYAYGEGVKQDERKAAEWFLKSAEQGYVNAQVMVGSLYHTGDGFEKDYTKAEEWYRKAADKGNEVAQYNLGVIYRAGKGVNKNTDEAIKWFRLSADQGYEPAQNELSSMERAIAGAAKQAAPAVEPPAPTPETRSVATESGTNTQNIEQPPSSTSKQTDSSANTSLSTREIVESENEPASESADSTLQQTPKTASENVVTETDTDSADTKISGGFFSRLKSLFNDDESEIAEEPTVVKAENPVEQPATAEKAPTLSKTGPVIKEKIVEESPDTTPPPAPAKKHIFKPAQNTGSIQELLTRQRVIAPEIGEQSIQSNVTTPANERTEPEPAMTQSPTEPGTPARESTDESVIPALKNTENKTSTSDIADENKKAVPEKDNSISGDGNTNVTEKKSTGLAGFFENLFSSSDNKIEPGNKKDTEDAIVQETEKSQGNIQHEDSYSATTYSADGKKSNQQLTDITEEIEKKQPDENQETPETTIVSKTEPVITDIEPEEAPSRETTVIDSEESDKSNNEKGGAGSFFGRLFGSDMEETNDNQTDNLSETAETATEPQQEIQPSQEEKPVEALQIAKADTEKESLTINNKVEQDIETTITNPLDSLRALAVSGDPAAQYELGNRYYGGDQVKQDFDEAFIWYRRSALQGNADAQYHLGTMYLMGEGIEQNDLEAKNWYEKAAEQGHEEAKHNLANLQRINTEKTTVTESQDESQSDKPEDQQNPNNKQEGVFGFMKGLFGSDKKDEEISQTIVTEDSVSPDTQTKPVEIQLKPPAESDHERGLAYTYGDGVPQNYTTAFKYFQSAALQGYAPAQFELGVAYESGRGTKKDINTAIEWYEKSAQQGYVMAQRSLGNIYMNGEGINQNRPLALAWYSILAEKGNVLDVHRRDLLKEQLTSEEIRESERLKQQLMADLSTASTIY